MVYLILILFLCLIPDTAWAGPFAAALGGSQLLTTILGSLAGPVLGALIGGRDDKPSAPTPKPVPVAKGPATRPDQQNFAQQISKSPLPTPEGISFGAGLSPEQQRAQIATGGTAGDTGLYRTPEVQRFYKDLAFRTLTDTAGNPAGEPLGVEQQFARDVLGVQPRQSGTASFLSALLRS